MYRISVFKKLKIHSYDYDYMPNADQALEADDYRTILGKGGALVTIKLIQNSRCLSE